METKWFFNPFQKNLFKSVTFLIVERVLKLENLCVTSMMLAIPTSAERLGRRPNNEL